jgi:hypothetical protein
MLSTVMLRGLGNPTADIFNVAYLTYIRKYASCSAYSSLSPTQLSKSVTERQMESSRWSQELSRWQIH